MIMIESAIQLRGCFCLVAIILSMNRHAFRRRLPAISVGDGGGGDERQTVHALSTQEFKDEALKQISDRGYSTADVLASLGVSIHNWYA